MAQISKRRQGKIITDASAVLRIYEAACREWGQEKVDTDHTRIWDLRCIWGIKGILPFGALESTNISEVLWVAETVCGLVQTPRQLRQRRISNASTR